MTKIQLISRADLYNAAFPKRPPLVYGNGMLVGTWMIGAQFRNPSRMPDGTPFYGGYPHGYLERVHSMFPDARNILHVFSGGLTLHYAEKMAYGDCPTEVGGINIELVDIHGPDHGCNPTWQGDLHDMPEDWADRFDLILADVPYSKEDATKYNCPSPNRRKYMTALRRVASPGANLVWLDTCWPQHRRAEWKTWGTIGLVRSTNHRMRLVSIFQAM